MTSQDFAQLNALIYMHLVGQICAKIEIRLDEVVLSFGEAIPWVMPRFGIRHKHTYRITTRNSTWTAYGNTHVSHPGDFLETEIENSFASFKNLKVTSVTINSYELIIRFENQYAFAINNDEEDVLASWEFWMANWLIESYPDHWTCNYSHEPKKT